MQTRNVILNNQRLLFIGPIYDKTIKLKSLEKLYNPNDILIFIGDISYPYNSFQEITSRINDLKGFVEGKKYFYILGDKDIEYMQKTYNSNADNYDWFNQQCIAINFTFANNYNVLAMHGGLMAKHKTLNDLNIDLDFSFEEGIPDTKKNWHKTYNGRLGFIVSSHPTNKDNKVKIYSNSLSLETNCHETNILSVQEMTDKGIGETYYL